MSYARPDTARLRDLQHRFRAIADAHARAHRRVPFALTLTAVFLVAFAAFSALLVVLR